MNKNKWKTGTWTSLVCFFVLLVASCYYFVCDCQIYGRSANGGSRIYSPNGEYYVVRYLSPFRRHFLAGMSPLGTAKLFDRNGKLLHSGPAMVEEEFGPFWHDSCRKAFLTNWVEFMGMDDPTWAFNLPTSPGGKCEQLELADIR